jgi:hypothetical protein
MIVAKAPMIEDTWLLWKAAKLDDTMKAALKADGLGITKEKFDGERWKIIWFYNCTEESFDEVFDEEAGEDLFVWQKTLNDITRKWIVKLAIIKDALLEPDEDSVEDPYA